MKHEPAAPRRPYQSALRDAATAQTRERVLHAAQELLSSPDGLERFSLDAVAQRAGVSRLTVYNQFGSRPALLEAVFDDLALRGGVTRVPAAMAEPDPRVALRKLVGIFCEFFVFGRSMIGSLHAASANDPELRQGMQQRNQRRHRAIEVLVERLRSAGEIADAAVVPLRDLLVALTSPLFIIELAGADRGAEEVELLVQGQVDDALSRAARGWKAAPTRRRRLADK
jgi:AcrR family transcriptional regulator